MPNRETWEFINSFAPWLAALGTISAVVVSLLLALRTTKIKLKTKAAIYNIVAPGQRVSDSPEYVQIQVVNHGFRDATVNGIMWSYKPVLGRRRTFVMVPPANPYSSTLPAKIAHGDSANFLLTIDEFKRGADTLLDVVLKAKRPESAVGRIRAGVYTSTGDEFLTRIDKTLREQLLEWTQKDAA